MSLNTQSEHSAMSEINVTPLVDVMLVLLIIFIVTTPLLMQAIQVKLPKTVPVAPITKPEHLHVTVDSQGKVFLEKNQISTMTALEAELKSALQRNPETGVMFSADENINYGRVAEVMALVQHAGISKMSIVTNPQR